MKAFFSLLLIVAKILRLHLHLKNELFYKELREKSLEKQDKYINEIEKLRDAGDSNSSDRADLLRKRLESERRELEHLSAFYNKVKSECSHSDH